jgi:NAD-dependent protein deacetylase/lipoamidase
VHIAADLIARLRRGRHVVVFTGAGVSAESGIPTFRDGQSGLWQNFDAQALATPDAFDRDPALVWGWYEWRRLKVLASRPNPAHRAIAALEQRVARFTLITQNVDDLHERAGSSGVVHLHGRICNPYCVACGREHTLAGAAPLPAAAPSGAEAGAQAEGGGRIEPPRCAHCGGRVRPGVVWFGESLPGRPWEQAVEAARSADAFLCIGTSSVVEPAAGLTRAAIAAGAATIQVNTDSTWLDERVTLNLRGPAAAVLPVLLARVWPVA